METANLWDMLRPVCFLRGMVIFVVAAQASIGPKHEGLD
jgi:cytochrome c oxidase assembly factor CtaG